ncbi:DUF3576 domain-containing protein [Litorimonas sp. RW-G-Af-16]|uniref:DUF3576 domain-containing protein n=1 Tax=Litorimonas sp. RW-G-Af-16 TaxID=3241168 RepID=UPI00390C4573
MSRSTRQIPALLGTAVLSAILFAGCSSLPLVGKKNKAESRKAAAVKTAPNMGVNSYLWRASLETLNFMPLAEVDPFGGVIITDWYASSEAPNERFKANVYILDTGLRADALKTSIFKQTRGPNGWDDAAVDADTARQVENAILTRARQLYIATVDAQ